MRENAFEERDRQKVSGESPLKNQRIPTQKWQMRDGDKSKCFSPHKVRESIPDKDIIS